MTAIRFLAFVCCISALACSGKDSGIPTGPSAVPQLPASPSPPPATPIPTGPSSVTLVGAGDIGQCHPETESTANMLAGADIVFTVGDNSNVFGRTAETYKNCFDATWGKFRLIMRPAPGNHDYDEPGAYAQHFGVPMYYGFDAGSWHVVALDSNGSSAYMDQQATWLRGELEANSDKCIMAYWHHPLFTSPGPNAPEKKTKRFWDELYRFKTKIVVNGHNHWYERFAPQSPDGSSDIERGIREFIVGTGGASLYEPSGGSAANSEVLVSVHGVIRVTLSEDRYSWQFNAIPGKAFADSGTGTCR